MPCTRRTAAGVGLSMGPLVAGDHRIKYLKLRHNQRGRGPRLDNYVPPGDKIPKLRDMRAVHSKLTEGRHMGVSTDEGITRGELREELHAFEQRLDKRFNDIDTRFDDINDALDTRFNDIHTRFNDISDTLGTVNKALSVIPAQTRASGRWWRLDW